MSDQRTSLSAVKCTDERRRAAIRAHKTLNGIDFLEVSTEPGPLDQRLLRVYFLSKQGEGLASLRALLGALEAAPGSVRIEGGVRVEGIEVTQVKWVKQDKAKLIEDHLKVAVDSPGDFSMYTLVIEPAWTPDLPAGTPALDPLLSRCAFSFKAGCPSRYDCCPPPFDIRTPEEIPGIDYLAKDFSSFQQMLVDYVPTLAPQWTEEHEADLGNALIELFAYMGDHLSYYQDAVANEAYLSTARQRVSVRRHARLFDYRMHDGASAVAHLHVAVAAGEEGSIPASTPVLTTIEQPVQGSVPGTIVENTHREEAERAAACVFETIEAKDVHAALNELRIHVWDDRACRIPCGAQGLEVVGDVAFSAADDGPGGDRGETWRLKPGDYVLVEEILDPVTGLEANADVDHRQIVRLTTVATAHDPLSTDPLTRLEWDSEDALRFSVCVSAYSDRQGGAFKSPVSVVRGNLILADHGRSIEGEVHAGPACPTHESLRRAHRVRLNEGPLSWRLPTDDVSSAAQLLQVDPRTAAAQVERIDVSGTTPSDDWSVVDRLLESHAFDHHVVVEPRNDGSTEIRFGLNDYGQSPPDGSSITVDYRVGCGQEGNIGAEALSHIVKRDNTSDLSFIDLVRNPLPAWGGVDPEAVDVVKQLAPAAHHAKQFRAVTEDDYANAAMEHPAVSSAVATFRWTGSWHTVCVTVDPAGRVDLPGSLQEEIRDWVAARALAGYDIEIDPPNYGPLDIEIDVCVDSAYFRADVEYALLDVLGNGAMQDGQNAFFHPDHFMFGQSLYLSALCTAIESVDGVYSIVVQRFRRFGKPPNGELGLGRIAAGRLEVLRLDNDPNFPENGVLQLRMRGGK